MNTGLNELKEIHLSLGHNSSAVMVDWTGAVICGYEQERLDRVKSSSAFPALAISACEEHGIASEAYVTHWFDRFDLPTCKYYDPDFMARRFKKVTGPSLGLTHHDMHANSAADFLAAHRNYRGVAPWYRTKVVVCDGFGNLGECLSVYDTEDQGKKMTLAHRSYGYANSLGLMYQYATSYLGMKENQDEYKLLGYESRILDNVKPNDAYTIREEVTRQAHDHANLLLGNETARPNDIAKGDALIDMEQLIEAKKRWCTLFQGWKERYAADALLMKERAVISFCVQTFIEECLVYLLKQMGVKECTLLLTGGCFYNVKLSKRIRDELRTCRVFVHPLAGDQGAALGNGPPVLAGVAGLAWGVRSLRYPGGGEDIPAGVVFVHEREWMGYAIDAIERDGMVNVVRGGMEYGPRALCNTSTLARPTHAMPKVINALNARSEIMPMAPVMTTTAAERVFNQNELFYSVLSDEYMVTTMTVKDEFVTDMAGAVHIEPFRQYHTARPQIVGANSEVGVVCSAFDGVLINTSFNYHGEPIVHTLRDAIATHAKQTAHAIGNGWTLRPTTLIVVNED